VIRHALTDKQWAKIEALLPMDFYDMRRLHSTNTHKTPIDHERLDKPEAVA
jgi:transposase